MEYSKFLNKIVVYKEVRCMVTNVPIPNLSDYFRLTPMRVVDDIGKGKGLSVQLTPMEFEVEVELEQH